MWAEVHNITGRERCRPFSRARAGARCIEFVAIAPTSASRRGIVNAPDFIKGAMFVNELLPNDTTVGEVVVPAALRVDVIADLICPWSYLGKRRLDVAMQAVKGPSAVRWYPFQINPAMPNEGMPFERYLELKFGGGDRMKVVLQQLTELGKTEGIEFRFDRLQTVPNTVNAHRLMALGRKLGKDTTAIAEDIYKSFFSDGKDIGDRQVLIEIAVRHGIDAEQVGRELDDEQTRLAVLAAEKSARESGVKGVPDFLLNRHVLVMGAQKTDDLIHAFDHAMFGRDDEQAVTPTLH